MLDSAFASVKPVSILHNRHREHFFPLATLQDGKQEHSFTCSLSPKPEPTRHTSRSEPFISKLNALDARVEKVKCPFWRRRFSDTLDATRQVLKWSLLTRHKSLPIPTHLYSTRPSTKEKSFDLSLETRMAIIRDDFTKRQYYVTGKLTTQLYRDDCEFDGPDPDVPVRGLAKYVAATAGLFDRRLSRVDLIDIMIVGDCVQAEWRLEGALNLPWKPRIKPYTGITNYEFDKQGLVCRHVETWSISAFEAFVSVLFPSFGKPAAKSVEDIIKDRHDRRPVK